MFGFRLTGDAVGDSPGYQGRKSSLSSRDWRQRV